SILDRDPVVHRLKDGVQLIPSVAIDLLEGTQLLLNALAFRDVPANADCAGDPTALHSGHASDFPDQVVAALRPDAQLIWAGLVTGERPLELLGGQRQVLRVDQTG